MKYVFSLFHFRARVSNVLYVLWCCSFAVCPSEERIFCLLCCKLALSQSPEPHFAGTLSSSFSLHFNLLFHRISLLFDSLFLLLFFSSSCIKYTLTYIYSTSVSIACLIALIRGSFSLSLFATNTHTRIACRVRFLCSHWLHNALLSIY